MHLCSNHAMEMAATFLKLVSLFNTCKVAHVFVFASNKRASV